MQNDIRSQITDFFAQYPLRAFKKGETLARPQADLPGVLHLVEGRVSQYDIAPSGNEVVINVFKPGAFFPMSSVINQTPNNYFFEASTAVTVRVAPPADVLRFLQENPDIVLDLLARVYRGTDGVLRRMAHLMGGDAKSRLLFELLNAAHRFGEQQDDGSVFVPLREGDLARHSGLARETISRQMRVLQAEGLVQVVSGGMAIPSVAALESGLGSSL